MILALRQGLSKTIWSCWVAYGKTVSLGKFEQTAVARNPDILIRPSKRAFMEALVAKAVEAAVAKLPSQIVR